MTLPLKQEQLQFMTDLACKRPEWLNPFFQFLSYFDSPYFFLVLIPALWLGVSYRWGLRVFYWMILNNLINSYAKKLIGWPRPTFDNPELGFFHPSSNGFPSGGAQTCLFLGGLLIYYWGTRKAWVLGIFYILLISFSRIYLGVHYPIDILGGWLFGLITLILFVNFEKPIENYLSKKGPKFSLLLSQSVPLAILLLAQRESVTYIMGSVMGVGIGTYFSLKHHLFLPPPPSRRVAIARSITAVAFLFLVLSLWPGENTFAKSFISGTFISLVASPICKWLFK